MWNSMLCMGLGDESKISAKDQIALFRKIGFEGFFSGWNGVGSVVEFRREADRVGSFYQSIHAPFGRAADMWKKSSASEAALDELLDCLRDCAEYDVPLMIVHTFIGFNDHTPTPEGVENFKRLADEAELLGVKLGFENTEGEEYLDAVLSGLADYESVGFCWDTGHELCYNRGRDMMKLYGDRLVGTHLNDNLGIRDFDGNITWHDDLHLLPFDGIADWLGIVSRLNKYHFDGPLTFELTPKSKPDRHENDPYDAMSPELYYTEAYKRACRVAALKRNMR